MRSKGSILLSRCDATLDQIARLTGRSISAAESWRNGTRSPGKDARVALEHAHGIPAAAWDELPEEEPARAPVNLPPAEGTRDGTKALAAQLEASLRADLAELETADMSVSRRVGAKAQAATSIMHLGKITGATVYNEREILSAPAWLHVERVIVESLRPWPEALRAMSEALANLEQKE